MTSRRTARRGDRALGQVQARRPRRARKPSSSRPGRPSGGRSRACLRHGERVGVDRRDPPVWRIRSPVRRCHQKSVSLSGKAPEQERQRQERGEQGRRRAPQTAPGRRRRSGGPARGPGSGVGSLDLLRGRTFRRHPATPGTRHRRRGRLRTPGVREPIGIESDPSLPSRGAVEVDRDRRARDGRARASAHRVD